jgi:DNA-binding NarL/FixJ family response regulator
MHRSTNTRNAEQQRPSKIMKQEKGTEIQLPQIIVFEDHPVFSAFLQRCIKQVYEVETCVSFGAGLPGIEYIEKLTTPPDLVLVDIGLPDISGLNVISEVRARFAGTRILVITVNASEGLVLAAIRSGATGYIVKEDPEIAIIEALRQSIVGIHPLSPSLAGFLFRLAGDTPPPKDMSFLTKRELQVLKLIANGKTYKETADLLDVGLSTIQMHIRNLYRKLNAKSRIEAVLEARNQGLVP